MTYNTEKINTMRNASHLLPDPGGEVVRGLLDEIERLQAELARYKAAEAPTIGTSSRGRGGGG